MYLTEELLTEWTGLTGRELSIFYLTYKKHAACALLHNDLEYIKQDIIKFKNTLCKPKTESNTESQQESSVKSLIQFWESKIIR